MEVTTLSNTVTYWRCKQFTQSNRKWEHNVLYFLICSKYLLIDISAGIMTFQRNAAASAFQIVEKEAFKNCTFLHVDSSGSVSKSLCWTHWTELPAETVLSSVKHWNVGGLLGRLNDLVNQFIQQIILQDQFNHWYRFKCCDCINNPITCVAYFKQPPIIRSFTAKVVFSDSGSAVKTDRCLPARKHRTFVNVWMCLRVFVSASWIHRRAIKLNSCRVDRTHGINLPPHLFPRSYFQNLLPAGADEAPHPLPSAATQHSPQSPGDDDCSVRR